MTTPDRLEQVLAELEAPPCTYCHNRGTICSCGDTLHVPCQNPHRATACPECREARALSVVLYLPFLLAKLRAAVAMEEAAEIIGYERDHLGNDEPVWTLDPAFDIVTSALTAWQQAGEEKDDGA